MPQVSIHHQRKPDQGQISFLVFRFPIGAGDLYGVDDIQPGIVQVPHHRLYFTTVV